MIPQDSNAPVIFSRIAAQEGKYVGIATFNVEKTLNALSMEMVQLLHTQLQAWEQDSSIAVVMLEGAGDKAFCAGGDLQNLYTSMRAHHASTQSEDVLGNPCALDFFSQEYRLDYLIHTYQKPILCWGHGIVMGGGIGLMAGASHRVVTEKSRLAMPEIAIGLFPDVGGSYFLSRMPNKLGLFLALTGASINSTDAKFIRLADVQLPHASKTEVLTTLQTMLWSEQDSDNHQRLHLVLQHLEAKHASAALPGPLEQQASQIAKLCEGDDLQTIVSDITSLASTENIDLYLQKAANNLQKGNPTSAWLAYALQDAAQHLSLAEVFRMELVAALVCAQEPDFAEGIRALIIDKDLQPHWKAENLNNVSAISKEKFFRSPWLAQHHPLHDLERSSNKTINARAAEAA
ncbi:enoyl-CoA hydratase/isomerase family protein [Undibacterium flavidum]|uniref:3-hydroxyisobutyryl-CoA hydrolase n=1 Tax=Undibacterium flavidum TaxID=2762297 RepID=A0ABR6YHD2_9BURK|nr:enoyl-CoA hydratase/isomerase family protein [Undibacterium flavidum]MBC3875917.1 enoyl-CoA hydratase/isomerase family protein [Undibacterium flavidum]